ncbi:MAG: aminoacyl-tRNA hydrolase [Parcubacteria group bacterium]
MYIIVGLGNAGAEYARTRHNTGRLAEEFIAERAKKLPAKFVYLDTFMNKSGIAIAKVVKSQKAAEKLVVIYDDLDLPLGTMRVSYNRSSGGHRGMESIIRALKTEAFIRIRIGISPITPSGKLKKPKGEEAVEKHILGEFKKSEEEILKKVFKRASEAVEVIISKGRERAMNQFNT